MIIIIFIALNLFLVISIALLIRHGLQSDIAFLRNSLRDTHKPPYPVELYVWVTSHDKNVCEDCIRRSKMRPMDIAEWMKIGLPGTPESNTCCGHQCRCRLMLYKMTDSFHI